VLVKFTRVFEGGKEAGIWINPSYVGYMVDAKIEGQTYVQMIYADHYAFVLGTLDEVAKKLNAVEAQ